VPEDFKNGDGCHEDLTDRLPEDRRKAEEGRDGAKSGEGGSLFEVCE
jgi:hypothetical protein